MAHAAGLTWGTSALIKTANSFDASTPRIAVDQNGNVMAVWVQSDGTSQNIYAKQSSILDTAAPVLLETSTMPADSPQIAADLKGNFIAVWRQAWKTANGALYGVYASRYDGQSWSAPAVVYVDTARNDVTANGDLRIAMDPNGNAVVAWSVYDWSWNHNSVRASRYIVGTGWTDATNISTEAVQSANSPQVAMDASGNAIVIWRQDAGSTNSVAGVLAMRYTVGTGWGTSALIGPSVGSSDGQSPQIAFDSSGNALAVWNDYPKPNMRSNRYVVGTGWGTVVTVTSGTPANSPDEGAKLAFDKNGNAMAVWNRYGSVLYASRYAAGIGWGNASIIESNGTDYSQQVAFDQSGNAIAIWANYSCNSYNIQAASYVVGSGWGAVNRCYEGSFSINTTLDYASDPQLVIDSSGRATAVWVQSGKLVTARATALPNMTNVLTGWNLLGNSSSTALDVTSTFGDSSKVTAVWKWIAPTAKWAFYTPSQTDGGVAYAVSKGFEPLTSVAGGEGFWVNAKTAFSVGLPTGTAVDSASFKNLASGWSLLATADNKTPSEFNKTLSFTTPAAGEIPSNFTSLWAWDAALANWYLYAPSLEQSGGLASYLSNKGYLNFADTNKKLGQGVGFWVNKSSPYTVRPVLPGTTTLESMSVTTTSGQSQQIQLSDGTSLNLPSAVTVVTASLNRQSNTLDLSSSGVETTGSMREVAITPSGSVPENYTIGITLPAAEYGSINPEAVTVARIGDLISDGQVMRDAITYLAVSRAVNGDLQVTDPFVSDTIAAAGGVTSGLSVQMKKTSRSLLATAVPALVKIKYVVVTFQRNLNWSKASQLVRMVPKVSEPARRAPLSSLSAADQAIELKRCSQNVVVLVHGHNEAEKIGYSPSSITVEQPWQQSYKRDVWTNFYDKFLSDFNTTEKNAQCTVFYEFIYPSYRSIFLHLGDELALMLAQEFKPQIAAKQNFNLFIIAHSQGGLVSRAAIQQFTQRAPELHSAFQRLVTWGSPHHGSPLNTLRYVFAAAPAYDLVPSAPTNIWFRTGYRRIRDYLADQAVDTPGTRDLRWDNQRALSLNDWFTMSSYQKENFHAAWYDLSNGVNLYNVNLAALNAGDIYGKSSAPRNKLNKQKYLFMYGITTSAYADWGTWTHMASNYEVSFGAMLIPNSLKDSSSPYLDTTLGGNDGASPVTSMAADGIDGLRESLGDVDHAQYYGAPDAPGHFTMLTLAQQTANLTLAYLEIKESIYACPTPTITSLFPTSGAPGATVTITGTGFGTTTGTVTFNGTTATVTNWSDTVITTTVPTGATTGNVVVTVGSVASNGSPFTVSGRPTITVTKSGAGSGTVTSSPSGIDCGTACSASFNAGTSVTLTATAASGSTFTGWSGGNCSGTGTCSVTVDAAKSVSANFNLQTGTGANEWTLTLVFQSWPGVTKGGGTVTTNGGACTGTCTVTLNNSRTSAISAHPDSNSNFGWWGATSCTTGTIMYIPYESDVGTNYCSSYGCTTAWSGSDKSNCSMDVYFTAK